MPFAGGRALKTPFGTFYGPNITPHPQAGIGRWSEADFMRAMREGRRPDGAQLLSGVPVSLVHAHQRRRPARPLGVSALAAAEQSAEPSRTTSASSTAGASSSASGNGCSSTRDRSRPTRRRARSSIAASISCRRSAIAANATRRATFSAGRRRTGFSPAPRTSRRTLPRPGSRNGRRRPRNFLTTGLTADGDVPAKEMGEVITNTTSQLTPQDLDAMIAYLRSLPPLPEEAK